MKTLKILIMMASVMISAACLSTGEKKSDQVGNSPATAKLEIITSIDGKEHKFEPGGSRVYHTAKNYSKNDDKFTTSSTTIHLVNFEVDSANALNSVKRALEKEGQYRVSFGFSGEKGTDEKTPIKEGEYPAKSDSFQPKKIDWVTFYYFFDGKEQAVEFDSKAWTGKLTVSAAKRENVAGSFDINDGKNMIKGSFLANRSKLQN